MPLADYVWGDIAQYSGGATMTSSQIDSLRNVAAQLGYPTTPGPIRSALAADRPGTNTATAILDQAKQDFGAVLQVAKTRIDGLKQAHPEAAAALSGQAKNANAPSVEARFAAWFNNVKPEYLSGQPVSNSLEPYFTPEMKSAAVEEFRARVADYYSQSSNLP
jgi:hypothetical protein